MAQRCGFCGKTEKQHKGPCIDPILKEGVMPRKIKKVEEVEAVKEKELIECPDCDGAGMDCSYCNGTGEVEDEG